MFNNLIKKIKMKTDKTMLQLGKDEAIRLYPDAAPEFKTMLESTFGKETFFKNIMDRIKSFEDVLKVIQPTDTLELAILSYSGKNARLIGQRAFLMVQMIAEVLNEGWKPDWSDSDEYKYYPWFEFKKGFGFSEATYDSWDAGTGVGSRLCFKNRELAEYAGSQFQDIYNEFLTFNKQ